MPMTPAQEKERVDEFRTQLLKDGIITEDGDTLGTEKDHTLLRFLRARKFNLKQSTTMVENCIQWRKTVAGCGLDELYKKMDPYDYPERNAVYECWPMWFHKTDKKGRPINVQSFGGVDIPKLYKSVTPERHWETVVANGDALPREVLPACSRVAGHLVDKCVVIVDLKGFGASKFWQIKSQVHDCFQMSQDYFAETMGQVVVINAPYGFSAVWNVIKPWLAKETQEKVDILGSNYQDVLLDMIDAENLPEMFGGTCTCENEGGCMMSSAGPWMPGRKERRERWLKGEGSLTEPSPWDEKTLSGNPTEGAISPSSSGSTTNGDVEHVSDAVNGKVNGDVPETHTNGTDSGTA